MSLLNENAKKLERFLRSIGKNIVRISHEMKVFFFQRKDDIIIGILSINLGNCFFGRAEPNPSPRVLLERTQIRCKNAKEGQRKNSHF